MGFYIILAIAALLIVGVILLYNRLVQKRQLVENGWSDIDVQLKRRADLIPSLVSVVEGYTNHEKGTFDDIVSRRNEALAAQDQTELRAEKESVVSRDISNLIALAENYPDLKANEQFLKLQEELSGTEDEISYARRFFNGAVRDYNTAIESVPANLIAGVFGFHPRAYFEAEQSDRALPELKLGS